MAKKKTNKRKQTSTTSQAPEMTYFGTRYYITHKAVANTLLLLLTVALIGCLWWYMPAEQTVTIGLGLTAGIAALIVLLPLFTFYFFQDRIINAVLGVVMLVTLGLTANWYRMQSPDILLFSGLAVAFTLVFVFTIQQLLARGKHFAQIQEEVYHPLVCPKDLSRLKFKTVKDAKRGKVHIYECSLCGYRRKGFT